MEYREGKHLVYCTECNSDVKISHRDRRDIKEYLDMVKHSDYLLIRNHIAFIIVYIFVVCF